MHENLWQWLCRMGRVGKLRARRSAQRFVWLLDDAHLQCGLARNATLREMATIPQNTFAWAGRNVKQNILDLCRVVLREITPDIHDQQEQPNIKHNSACVRCAAVGERYKHERTK